MNKLADLDKLILEVLGEEAPPPKPEKGGFTGGAQAGSSTKHTGLALADIVSILAVGTETDKVIKSSHSAYQALLKSLPNKTFDSTSAQSIAKFFAQFDFAAESIKDQTCSSLSALISKYAIASGLVWVFHQFNNQAGGYVHEAFMSELVGGESVPVGGGGIEDILVNKSVGLNLKVKDTTAVHGSLTQLLETLNVPYVAVWDTDEEGGKGHYKVGWPGGKVRTYAALKLSPNATAIGIDKETKFAGGQQIKGQTVYVTPKSPITELYYLFFRKKSGDKDNPGMGLTLHVCKINKDSVKAGKYENGYAVLSTVNNPLGGIDGLIRSSSDYAKHEFTTKFDVKSMNEALQEDAGEVFESLKKLDAWYGALKGKVMDYVTSLEKKQLDDLQRHLDEGEQWKFKALTKKCDN
tara:strand:- start:1118 stop:2344 length:1227 start_codon:yes stop_codon:yes gene_type:complete